ncbi:MAG: HisA/HisF-related TIM barrel protein [Cyclobacteriaceae bacterium]|nr:imidazole glycerol phosphate synthase subunit HisF [Cyclobacteriaceae bacterium]
MRRVRVIPIILLDEGRAVITQKFGKPIYVGDPINAIKILNDKEVDELIILDITKKGKRSAPDFDLIATMASESFMPLAYGGHVKSVSDAERIIKSGIEKISFNSALFSHPQVVREFSQRFGSQSTIASIDIKKNFWGTYDIRTLNGNRKVGTDIEGILTTIAQLNVGEILINSIDHDGTLKGYDIPLIRRVAACIDVPLIACGGASSISDFFSAVSVGKATAVAAGAMFFFKGSFDAVLVNYPDQKALITHLYNNLD